jgi:2'-5' RNA ligase
MPGRSAVIVPIALPPRLASLRDAVDPLAARGVPAHVTVLFPFLAADALTPTVRSALARSAARNPPFIARFSGVEYREEMVWLMPEDRRPFLALTESVASRWPDHPPYGGIHDTLIPHLTLIETADDSARGAGRAAAAESCPFDVAVPAISVIAESASGAWRTRWRLPLGGRTAGTRSAP